jgi:hypothetical protein
MLFPWCVDAGATAVDGTIQYSIRFYKVDAQEDKFLYNWNTIAAKTKVLKGMEVQEMNQEYNLAPTVYDEVLALIRDYGERDLYWDEAY